MRTVVFILISCHFSFAQIFPFGESTVSSTMRYSCSFSNEKKIQEYNSTDPRVYSLNGRHQLLNEAWKKAWEIIRSCRGEVGLNFFNFYFYNSMGPVCEGELYDYRKDNGTLGSAGVFIQIKYSQIQRKDETAAFTELKHKSFTYPENGVMFFEGGFFNSWRYVAYSSKYYQSYVNTYGKVGEGTHGKNYRVEKGETVNQVHGTITIYPLVFERNGFFMEGEKAPAENIIDALIYVILHELGHIEYDLGYKLSNISYPKIERGEKGADNFASSVRRCF